MLGNGTIVGSYRIGEAIGEGGMCAVYRGTHTLLDRHVAIKVLLPEHAEKQEIVQRFFNEARALTKLADPGIVQVFDYGHDSIGSPYIVMEFLEGESMARRLSRVNRFGLLEGVRLMRLMCTSLGVAHAKGIIHRDLKPDNIFLVADPSVPDGERAKILDFGIAKIFFDEQAQTNTRTNALIGTPTYMSPEQCNGGGGVDCRSDIYSMGCVMFAMITGQPPFRGAGLGDVIAAHLRERPPLASSRVPELHRIIDAILDRCLRKSPAERFQSMPDLSRVLGSVEHALSHSIKELDNLVLPGVDGDAGIPERTVSLRSGSPPMRVAQEVNPGPNLSGTTISITTLGAATELAPPWSEIPTLPWGSPGWRVSGGEVYLRRWRSLMAEQWSDRDQMLTYLLRHPRAPHRWRSYLCSMIEKLAELLPPSPSNPSPFWNDFEKATTRVECDRILEQWGLVGNDVAYPEHVRNSSRSGALSPPWELHNAADPSSALRFNSRAVGWWARWLRHDCPDVRTYLDAHPAPSPWTEVVTMIRRGRSAGWVSCKGGAATLIPEMVVHGVLPPPWFGEHPPLTRAVVWSLEGEGDLQPDDRDRWVWWLTDAFDDHASWQAYLRRWSPPVAWQAALLLPPFSEIDFIQDR